MFWKRVWWSRRSLLQQEHTAGGHTTNLQRSSVSGQVSRIVTKGGQYNSTKISSLQWVQETGENLITLSLKPEWCQHFVKVLLPAEISSPKLEIGLAGPGWLASQAKWKPTWACLCLTGGGWDPGSTAPLHAAVAFTAERSSASGVWVRMNRSLWKITSARISRDPRARSRADIPSPVQKNRPGGLRRSGIRFVLFVAFTLDFVTPWTNKTFGQIYMPWKFAGWSGLLINHNSHKNEFLFLFSLQACNGDPCMVQTREVTCSDSNAICDHTDKPIERRLCGNITCGTWSTDNWSPVGILCWILVVFTYLPWHMQALCVLT